jgi:hypothetical protein
MEVKGSSIVRTEAWDSRFSIPNRSKRRNNGDNTFRL